MSTRRKATLADVAARAGVSTTTASYVLNARSQQMRIATETQDRVHRAVAELAYRPNRSARSLRTRKTASLAVISDFVASGHFASGMLAGASVAARAHDHVLLIGETQGDPDIEHRLIEEMLDRQVDGFVLASLVHRVADVPRMLTDQATIPTVLLNCVDRSRPLPAVVPDEVEGGRLAARLLLDAGCADSIVVVGQDPTADALAGPLRWEGVTAALAASGRRLAGLIPCDWNVGEAHAAVSRWLAEGAHPRGMVCMNDRIALGTYQALDDHRLRVGRDVAVVSFDGTELATWLRPQVSSVALPFAELGSAAVELLMREGGPGHEVHRLSMPLVAGESAQLE
ncbi:MAG: LacI family DNA-binding transcriptional regulator [Nocardioides sp.]